MPKEQTAEAAMGLGHVSILNDVLGPVMRGPSSSHTAGSFRIGKIVRSLLGGGPVRVKVTVDPAGSMAPTLVQLGVDVAFVAGAMGWSMLDEDYTSAIQKAKDAGVRFDFETEPLEFSEHPNAMWIEAEASNGLEMSAGAESIGGGLIRFTHVCGWAVLLTGETHEVLVEADRTRAEDALAFLNTGAATGQILRAERHDLVLLHARFTIHPDEGFLQRLRAFEGVRSVRLVEALYPVKCGDGLFSSSAEMVTEAEKRGVSLGRVALAHESALLGMSEGEILEELTLRLGIMEDSVRTGLDDSKSDMMLLGPTAGRILEAESTGHIAIGGIQTRAAARAMAAMHACNSRAVVCAAPTGGSAGVIPGVLCSLIEERGLERETAVNALLAAGAVGAVVSKRATFAAETAGCQVEIGAAGAMAAAAVVEVAGGSPQQAADAAAIALQNTMGSVCDPVQGTCEVPCHTRNAVAASSAYVCADLVLGGYKNPVPLDETIDASFQVGKTLPRELRCTAAGGLAIAPSALRLKRLR